MQPNIRFKCSRNVQKKKRTLVLLMNNRGWRRLLPPLPFRRVSNPHVPECTFNTSPCMPAPRAACHTPDTRHHTPHRTHTTPQHKTHPYHHNNTTTTPHENRDRETETDRDRESDRERRRRQRREEKREERREKREDSLSVWWCMAVFSWCSALSCSSRQWQSLSLAN